MKINLNSGRLLNIVLAIISLIIVFQIYSSVFVKSGLTGNRYDSYTITSIPPPIDPPVSEKIPHDRYVELTGNIKNLRKLKNGEWLRGSGIQFGYIIGTATGRQCDTCTLDNQDLKIGMIQNYITLPGWRLKNRTESPVGLEPPKFFVKNGQSYVRRPIKNLIKETAKGHHYNVHFIDDPVKFRYNTSENYMMIPVSGNIKILVSIVGGTLLFVFLMCALYLLRYFALFIIDLSKGHSFTDSNIHRLKFIAVGLLGLPIALFLLTLLMRLIFINYFSNNLVLNENVYNNYWQCLALGVVFLLLFKAFKQGKALQEENDLTV